MRRLFWPERSVVLVLASRLVNLISAPVTLYLVATSRPPAEQGFYFIFYNVQAIAQLFETGIATALVQFAGHVSANHTPEAQSSLSIGEGIKAEMKGLLSAAQFWYLRAAGLIIAVLLPAGLLFFRREAARTGTLYAVYWIIVVAMLGAYISIVPVLASLEGLGFIDRVQRMRVVQAVATTATLWIAIPRLGALAAVAIASLTQFVVAFCWLWHTARGLLDLAAQCLRDPSRHTKNNQKLAGTQWSTAAAWVVAFIGPQTLGMLVFAAQGAAASGQLGISLAAATAPLTLATAWLHARYPRYARLVSRADHAGFNRLALDATRQSVTAFVLGSLTLLAGLAVMQPWLPEFSRRFLSLSGVAALAAGNAGALGYQALSGYLRAHQIEPLLSSFAWGTGVTLALAAIGSRVSASWTAYAYAIGSLGVLLPLMGITFQRARRELDSTHVT